MHKDLRFVNHSQFGCCISTNLKTRFSFSTLYCVNGTFFTDHLVWLHVLSSTGVMWLFPLMHCNCWSFHHQSTFKITFHKIIQSFKNDVSSSCFFAKSTHFNRGLVFTDVFLFFYFSRRVDTNIICHSSISEAFRELDPRRNLSAPGRRLVQGSVTW